MDLRLLMCNASLLGNRFQLLDESMIFELVITNFVSSLLVLLSK